MISPWKAFNTVKIKRYKIILAKHGINNFFLVGVTLDFEATNKDEMKLFLVMRLK